MRPALFLLTGFPGVGKLTVARALATRIEAGGETVRVIDNHWINNPIFGLIEQDGLTPLPREVWNRVGEVADAVIHTVEGLTPPQWHVIFTSYINGIFDASWVDRLAALAESRRGVFVPVRLLCETEENTRRILAPERRKHMKSIDSNEPQRLADIGPPYDPGHTNTLTLDITAIAPAEAASAILAHVESLG